MDQFDPQAKIILCIIRMKARKLCLGWISHLNADCSAAGKVFCLSCMLALSLSNHMAGSCSFFNEEGREGLGHHWGCMLWSPENPGEMIWWRGKDCCYVTWGKQGGSAPARATWDVRPYFQRPDHAVCDQGCWTVRHLAPEQHLVPLQDANTCLQGRGEWHP